MTTTSASVRINAQPDDVFAELAQPLAGAQLMQPGPIKQGTEYVKVVNGKPVTITVTAYEPASSYCLHFLGADGEMKQDYQLAPDSGGTRVTLEETITTESVSRLALAIAKPMRPKKLAQLLNDLKGRVERLA